MDNRVLDVQMQAAQTHERLLHFLAPLLISLDRQLDARLVRTGVATIAAIVSWRNRAHGLLLSELGAYVLSPAQAPAGTKRLSNLLRSVKWSGAVIERCLWYQAQEQLASLERQAEPAYLVWDTSVLEKPESTASEEFGPVRSSKAGRLTRYKRGYSPPPPRPIFVPGLHWLSLLLVGPSGPPTVAAMRWWSTRGAQARDKRTEEGVLLQWCAQQWGGRVLHLWDRGFAGSRWLGAALDAGVRFVVRWPTRYHLVDEQARPAWQIVRGKRSWDHRLLWDGRRHCWRKTGVLATMVWLPAQPEPLWLVVARRGEGQSPWYLLTTEPIETTDDAWAVVVAYAKRWQIELTFRYGKSELALESPRLWTWERRHKLLLLVTLAYAFLLSLCDVTLTALRVALLRHWCHRTGKRSQETLTPLYRLRSALSRLWLAYPLSSLLENSG